MLKLHQVARYQIRQACSSQACAALSCGSVVLATYMVFTLRAVGNRSGSPYFNSLIGCWQKTVTMTEDERK